MIANAVVGSCVVAGIARAGVVQLETPMLPEKELLLFNMIDGSNVGHFIPFR